MMDLSRSDDPTRRSRSSRWVLFAIVLGLLGLQYFASLESTRHSTAVLQELRSLDEKHLTEEKLRQEAIAGRIKNEEQSVFLSTLVTNVSALIGILVAFTGAWIGLAQFLDVRRKESSERAALEFNKLWEGISQADESARAASIAGLQVFLGPDYRQFHGRTASALAVCARLQSTGQGVGIVAWTLGPVLQQLVRVCPQEFCKVSWRGSKLRGVDFSGADLSGVDFRDASLVECNFENSTLRAARFDAAVLTGAKFAGANLQGACLTYADMAYASVREADLSGAMLNNIKLLNLDMRGADLRSAKVSAHATDWRLARGWREANMEAGLMKRLLAEHGPAEHGLRILMLLWEFPPFVSGGQWTAAYHLLRNLRKAGARLTVLIPSSVDILSAEVFGSEIEVIGANVLDEVSGLGAYDQSGLGAYKGSGYGGYAGGKRVFEYIRRFTERLPQIIDDYGVKFDLIHAHDWLTFQAAEKLAHSYVAPWVAHFHSVEKDRTSEPSYFIESVEKRAGQSASRVVVPSELTRQRLLTIYGMEKEKIAVIPNCMSGAGRAEVNIGYRQSRQVVYSGRMSWQKAPERFIRIAKSVWSSVPTVTFSMYGSGSKDEMDALNKTRDMLIVETPKSVIYPPSISFTTRRVRLRYIAPLHADGSYGDVVAVENDPPAKPRAELEEMDDYRIAMELWKKQRTFINGLFQQGFILHPLAETIAGIFTHRLDLQGELEEGAQRRYLVLAEGSDIPLVKRRNERIINMRGALTWDNREKAFDDAAVMVVPSRNEPFGMIVLEAMQHGVPVLYPKEAGVAEVLGCGIPFDPDDEEFATREIQRLVEDEGYWTQVVDAQYREIEGYAARGYERRLTEVWQEVVGDRKVAGESSGISA